MMMGQDQNNIKNRCQVQSSGLFVDTVVLLAVFSALTENILHMLIPGKSLNNKYTETQTQTSTESEHSYCVVFTNKLCSLNLFADN